MCWLDYVRNQGFECPSHQECFLYLLSIVDYKKRSIRDGVDFLMSNCPTLERVVIGMGNLHPVTPKSSDPESIIENYLSQTRAKFEEGMKRMRIPEELKPERDRLAVIMDAFMKETGAKSLEDVSEKLLDTIHRKRRIDSD